MKKVTMAVPDRKNILGAQISNYPQGYDWPYDVLVREAWESHRDALLDGGEIEFSFAGYGVLTMRGRAYTFVLTKEYARRKGYADSLEGNW